MTGAPSRSTPFWTAIAALLAIALYLPTIGYGFLYDSSAQVWLDNFVHTPKHWWDVLTLRVMGMDVIDFNRPVALASLMLDSALWGRNPAGYHLTNLLLQGTVVALLLRWFLALTGSLPSAFFAALLFAVHPLLCETVVEIGYREDLLSTLFVIAGLYGVTRFEPRKNGSVWVGAGIVTAFFLAVGSKESGIAGAAVLPFYWLFFRRQPGTHRAWLLLLGTVWLACGGFLAARFLLEPQNSIIFTEKAPPIANSWSLFFLTQSRIWTAEFLRIVWPTDLCADYTPYTLRNIGTITGGIVVGTVLLVQVVLGWRSRLLALAAILFWFSLLPVSNFMPLYRPMADRFLYLPLTGVALAAAVVLAWVQTKCRRPEMERFLWSVVAVALIPLAILTFRETRIWESDERLWEETTKRNPNSYTAWVNLACALVDIGKYEEAIEPLKNAANLTQGKLASPFVTFALLASAQGRDQDAGRSLGEAIRLDARYTNPDALVDAVTLAPWQASRLKVIALRFKNL